MAGEHCTASCATRDHESFGACVRDKGLRVGYAASANGMDFTRQKKWDQRLNLYREARSAGLQPESTRLSDIRKTLESNG